MRVSKLSIWVMCLAMVLNSLTLFSFASETVALNNSGSTEISMMAMRSVAASEGVALTAAEGDSGQFGYNIESFNPYYSVGLSQSGTQFQIRIYDDDSSSFLPSGQYSFTFDLNFSPSSFGLFYDGSSYPLISSSIDGNTITLEFSISSDLTGSLLAYFNGASSSSSLLDFSAVSLFPVEGISSGYTYSSGVLDPDDRDKYSSFTASFGNQPAGKYLINIYHWGDNYKVNFDISDANDQYSLPTSTIGGVTTTVYNHPGGMFSLSGDFSASNDVTPYVDGYVYGSVDGSFTGKLQADSALSWVFNITDIVAIPYEQAADSNFGFFAPIIGFFNDHFSSMKAWIATQIDKIAGDDATQAEVDSASSALQKEVDEVNELSNNLSSQTSNLEQQFTTDFAVPSEVTDSSGTIQSIYTSIFGFLGAFSIFIWLPVVFAVIKKLLRL